MVVVTGRAVSEEAETAVAAMVRAVKELAAAAATVPAMAVGFGWR